jgi:HK97 family phage major capsid protein
MSKRSRELREKRGKLHADATEILKKGDQMTAEDRASFDRMMAEIDTLKADVDREERAAALEAELRETERPQEAPIGELAGGAPEARSAAVREYRQVLKKHAKKHGVAKALEQMNPDNRRIVLALEERWWTAFRNSLAIDSRQGQQLGTEDAAILAGRDPEFRDMGVGSSNDGGSFVPQGFVYNVETAMKFYGQMLEAGDIMDTATGQPLPWPTQNDTSISGEQISENNPVNKQDLTTSSITFGAFKYSTKMIPISLELLQDSAFDLESYVTEQFAIRLGRILNNKFTLGVGTTEPQGIIVGATSGVSAAAGSSTNTGGSETGATSIGTTDLTDLEHSVDRAYRVGAAWMMHDSTEKFLKELLDKYGRPLWRPGVTSGAPDSINGYPYFVNNDMAVIGASNKTVLFGQLKKYKIRRVKELRVMKLVERFADYGQIALLGFARYDGQLLDAGTHPVKYLVQHS